MENQDKSQLALQPYNTQNTIQEDAWANLRNFTQARIALGSTGVSVPLREVLQFKLAHAHAKDAVYSTLMINDLAEKLSNFQFPVFCLQSRVKNRNEYLQRPDLGRRLHENSVATLKKFANKIDILFVIVDGLSATGINQHTIPVLDLLLPMLQEQGFSDVGFALVEQGRVAIGDEVGELLGAKLSVVMIGERPGLSSFDSVGVYISFNPKVGLTDESRNCISNIRTEGLHYNFAAEKMAYLITQALHLQLSGVDLKDETNLL